MLCHRCPRARLEQAARQSSDQGQGAPPISSHVIWAKGPSGQAPDPAAARPATQRASRVSGCVGPGPAGRDHGCSAGLQLSPRVMRPEENTSFCLGIPSRVHNLCGPPSALADSIARQPWPLSLQCQAPEVLPPECWSVQAPCTRCSPFLSTRRQWVQLSPPSLPCTTACAGRCGHRGQSVTAGVAAPPQSSPGQARRQQVQRARSLGGAALDLETGARRRNHSPFKPRRGNGHLLPPPPIPPLPTGRRGDPVGTQGPWQLQDSRAAPSSLSPRVSSSAMPGCQQLAPVRQTARQR